ncbi:hypothetical protein QFZ80_005143 [Paenibacillus sp. V4I7]|nr:hypothetical protein [Paenibacillus sp. V4I7]
MILLFPSYYRIQIPVTVELFCNGIQGITHFNLIAIWFLSYQ